MIRSITSKPRRGAHCASAVPRVSLTPGFILAAALVFYLDGDIIAWSALAAAVHELGHALAIYLLGGRVTQVRISVVGVEMALDSTRNLSYPCELAAALAGPVVSLLAAYCAARHGAFLFAGLSLALGLFNLLPARQLDGGRAIYALLAWLTHEHRAARVTWVLSILVAGGLLGVGAALIKGVGNITLFITAIWVVTGILHGESK